MKTKKVKDKEVRRVGRPCLPVAEKKISLSASVTPQTMERINVLRGSLRIGQFLDEIFKRL